LSIERSILKGKLAGTVETRNMFTCLVIEVGGDTSAVLWTAYMSSLMSAIEDLTNTIAVFYEYEVQEYITGHWVPKDIVTISGTGSESGDTLPFQNAIVFIAKCAGLRKVGRKFIGGITSNTQSAGVLLAGQIVDAAAFLAAWLTPFTGISGGHITPGILDKTSTFQPFVGGFVSSLLGSMRRRKPGLGI